MIKNDRQYKITRSQADRFRASVSDLGRDIDAPGPTRLELAQLNALESQLADLEEQLREYEHLKSGEVRVFRVNNFDELPKALIRARIAAGLTQKDLADRLGLHEQQIQQYEANEFASASFSRLKQIAEAVGVMVANDVFLPIEVTGKALLDKFGKMGFDRPFIERRLVPLSTRGRLESMTNANDVSRVASHAARTLNLSSSELLTNAVPSLNTAPLATVRHKLSKRADGRKVSLYTVYAHHLALLALEATAQISQSEVPEDTDDLHDAIVKAYGSVSFETTLKYVWNELGIPVLPLRLHGGFHGAAWRVQGRNVIVLNPSQRFPAFWLDALLHEVGHASQEPTASERSVVEVEPTWESDDNSDDEQDARHFAIDTVFRSRAEELRHACENEAGSVEGLKRAVEAIAERERVPTDSLALIVAASLKQESWWGAAMNLQAKGIDAFEIARREFLAHINMARLSAEDREIMLLALQGDDDE